MKRDQDPRDEALVAIGALIAKRQRPLCPSCAKRSVNRHGDWCSACVQDREEAKRQVALESKRRWWEANK